MLSVLVIAHTAAHVAARDDIEAIRAKDLNEMFPVANAEVAPMLNPRGFANLLWKQLNHLGNTGFDLALFRVNAYSNMLYLHADSTSPLTRAFSRAYRTQIVTSRFKTHQDLCDGTYHGITFHIVGWIR
ncbi:hypothetical protein OsJ_07964 [Oryza sativa Japonica Group]|uniref:rRNA N-glycosidase n=1 Tax=Oryza sativa subsp. japonica TaxID=39947 RepID=B9F1V5_ORYSJ|nr:hypothetical protein OsJ_07964 [Oryza sativa Japonica Group]